MNATFLEENLMKYVQNTQAKDFATLSNAKRAYQAPQLTKHGSVAELTRGAISLDNDSTPSSGYIA